MVTYAKEYENYIISDFREESLSTLVPGSESEKFIKLIRRIVRMEQEDTNKKVRANYLFRKYDLETTTAEEKEEILNEINLNYYGGSLGKPTHEKPIYFNQNSTQIIEEVRHPSHFDEKQIEIEESLNLFYEKNIKYITSNLSAEFTGENLPWLIDFSKFSDETFLEILNQPSSVEPKKSLHKLYLYDMKIIERLAKLAFKPNLLDMYELSSFLNRAHKLMTTVQLEHYITLLPESFNKDAIISEIINRKFNFFLDKAKSSLEKRKILINIYEYLLDKPLTFNSMRCDTLLLILENGIQNNIYDLKLFKEYLDNPLFFEFYNYNLKNEKIEQIKQWSNNRQNICNLQVKSGEEEKSIVSKYLRHFFLYEKVPIEEFTNYFKTDYLVKTYQTMLVLRGEEDETIIKSLTDKVYEEIIKKTEITICEYNKEKFDVNEEVKIDVEIKNVNSLFVKIFEINTENYYYNKRDTLNTAISLEGLIASDESAYSFAEKPQKLVKRTLTFEKINNRRGIFVIEFIGSGYSSRAIVKKGSLSLVTRPTVNGKFLFILDENQNICKGERSGLWIKEQFHKCEASGAIVLPYQQTSSTEKVVLVHEDFAEITSLNLEVEQYRLDGTFILNYESVLMGNVAKAVFRPSLYINNRPADLKNLINSKVTVTLVKTENDQSIPITNMFEGEIVNSKIREGQDIEVEFAVPPRLVSVNMTFTCDVKNKSQDKLNPLSYNTSYNVTSQTDYKNKYSKLFLNKTNGKYTLTLLGRNGEAKPDVRISLKLQHSYKNLMDKDFTFLTDKQGNITLGSLKNVNLITVDCSINNETLEANFLVNCESIVSYPKRIDIIEGEDIKLPLAGNTNDMKTFYCFKKDGSTILENLTDKVEFHSYDKEDLSSECLRNTHRYLTLNKLTEGTYTLGWNANKREILINVHKGQYWDNENFIITDSGIIENTENRNPLYLEKFSHSKTEKKIKLKIGACNKGNNPRVHLFAYKFYNEIESQATLAVLKRILDSRQFNKFSFQNWKNIYLSNRLLNEEIQYVFDRKQYERTMGNSLERPSLLVKRQFVRDTTTLVQDAKEGGQYERKQIQMVKEKECFSGDMMERKKMRRRHSNRGMGDDDASYVGEDMMITFDMLLESYNKCDELSTFHNFLGFTPLVLTNLIPNEEGEIQIEANLENYSILHAIVVDNKSIYEENLYLETESNNNSSDLLKRDLTMTNPLQPEKFFSELRKTKTLLKGEKFSIADITSTNFQIIDSLDKVISFFSLTPGYSNYSSNWSKLNFLLKFNDLSQNEKLKKWSENFSHDVNIFLFFRHPDFFTKFVKPVIKYKSEKTFVDFFLLNDIKRMKDFTAAAKIESLNTFEQCLLILAIRKSDPDFARVIAKNIRTQAEANKISGEEMKRLFNIVMNMKKEEIDTLKINEALLNLDMKSECLDFSDFSSSSPKLMMSRRAMPMKEMCTKPQMKKMKRCVESKSVMENLDDFADFDQIQRPNIRNNLTKEGGKSKEYCETHYFNNISKNFSSLIRADSFFADLASFWVENEDISNFTTGNILTGVHNIHHFISILAVLGLNVNSVSHGFDQYEGRGVTITPESNMIIFTKEISETESDIKPSLMLAQLTSKMFPSEVTNNKSITEDFLVNEIYKHETIVTNISNKTLNFELLIQIPQGAIPVEGSDYTKTVNLALTKFMTTMTVMYFYFPKTGEFISHPPSAAMEGKVIAKTAPKIYKVKDTIVKLEHTSLDDVLQSGSKNEILNFISKIKSLESSDLSKIYWLLKDKEFYYNLITILKQRGIFDNTVWTYSYLHRDMTTLKDLLSTNSSIRNAIGPCADFSLFELNNTNNFDIINHKDYHPILNPRVHRLANEKKSTILNVQFKATYQEFINYLVGLKSIDNKNLLRLCYYLILQDRIEEALKVFERIDLKSNDSKFDSLNLQYDYINAYLDFSFGYPEFKIARKICDVYKEFPIATWRDLFEEISDQLAEYDGRESFDGLDLILDEEKKKKQSNKLAAETEAKLSFTINNKSLDILYTNTKSILVKFYLIDLEILFSRTPFIKQNSDDFSFVQPNFIKEVTFENCAKEKMFNFVLPEEFVNNNLFIEVSSQNKKCFDTYFSTSLVVNISEALGEVKVLDTNLNILTKVYVKCFAKYKDNSVKFYKDGYTDLRGKFNYVSLNSNGLKNIQKFSLFIAHDSFGSTIKESNPPSNIESFLVADSISGNANEYDMYQNYRQEMKNVWKQSKKKE